MLVTNLNYCEFYVWSNGKTNNDKFLVTIKKDIALSETILAKHVGVFDKELLLKQNLLLKNLIATMRACCLCRRPTFPPRIACDNKCVKLSGSIIQVLTSKRQLVKAGSAQIVKQLPSIKNDSFR